MNFPSFKRNSSGKSPIQQHANFGLLARMASGNPGKGYVKRSVGYGAKKTRFFTSK